MYIDMYIYIYSSAWLARDLRSWAEGRPGHRLLRRPLGSGQPWQRWTMIYWERP